MTSAARDVTIGLKVGDTAITRASRVLRCSHGEHSGERIVFNRDCLHGFPKLVPIRMSYKQDRLLGVIDDAISEARLIIDNERDAIAPGNIFRADYNIFVPVDTGSETDFANCSARNLAANGCAVEHDPSLWRFSTRTSFC